MIFVTLLWIGSVTASWAAASPAAPNPGQITKVVRQYALTSANDFPQRDPLDWRLQGSCDEGKTWTVLDIRKGEIFADRHQRRVFRLTNSVAFNIYRLQIDRVRDPARADAVQLAEIEPMGETEEDIDTVPILNDIITSQGENTPLESRLLAFDGQVETKWLDDAVQEPTTRASWIQWQYASQAGVVLTNVKQVIRLRTGASRAYPVRIDGWVVGRLRNANSLCFWDGAEALAVHDGTEPVGWSPGQRVLLEGIAQWTDKGVEVRQPHLQARGPTAPSEPRRIGLEQPLAPEEDLTWMEAEGRIQFCSSHADHLTFEIGDGQRSLSVKVLHAALEQTLPPSGTWIRATGLCEAVLNEKGQRVVGTLWLASVDAISPAAPMNASANSSADHASAPPANRDSPQLSRIQQVRDLSREELDRGPRFKIRGVITEPLRAYLQDETAGIEMLLAGEALRKERKFGEFVEVEGWAGWGAAHGPYITVDKILVLGKGKPPEPKHFSLSQLASGQALDQWIEFEGVVHSTDGSHLLLACEDGQLMATLISAPAEWVRNLVDASVRLRGVGVTAADENHRVRGIHLLIPSQDWVEVKQAPADGVALPVRTIGSLLRIEKPGDLLHRVKVEGVLAYREGPNFFLQDATGSAMAVAKEDVILKLPPGASRYFWRESQAKGSTAGEGTEVTPGDRIEVVGFPETGGYSPILTEAAMRKVSRASLPPPVKAPMEEMTMGKHDSALVSLEAVLLNQTAEGPRFVFDLLADGRLVQAFLPTNRNVLPNIVVGSRVSVSGVCHMLFNKYTTLGRSAGSFELLVASPHDFTILERAPWWTLRHTLAAIGVMSLTLVLSLLWIHLLRREVGSRTRQLSQEIEEHEKTEAQLAEKTGLLEAEIEQHKVVEAELEVKRLSLEREVDERKRMETRMEEIHQQLVMTSRQAGMAEVATSVLHNVGNVLNSVNVAAIYIADQVRKSKVASVERLAQWLADSHAQNGHFLTEDEKGRQLPGHLKKLAAALANEQSRLLGKVSSLTENVQHIKEIVSRQQNYASVSGVLETVPIASIVEDALRLHSGALARQAIQVVREYSETPLIPLDRHKVLQILFNLFQNATLACEESGRAEKQVTVSIKTLAGTDILVSVADNGIGIPPENLTRIFAQGFSTRQNGHGFGLHSSILAAQEMGGSLSARSDGPGTGATFTLRIPIGGPAREPAGSPSTSSEISQ
jgi:signal transduction histidine kinase